MVLSESENLSGPSSDEPPVSSPTIPPVVSDQQPSTSHSRFVNLIKMLFSFPANL